MKPQLKKYIAYLSSAIFLIAGAWFFLVKVKVDNIKMYLRKKGYKLMHEQADELVHVGLGDSVARGFGAADEKSYMEKASAEIEKKTGKRVAFYNYGRNHLTSDGLLMMIQDTEIIESIQKANLISLNIGGNDLLKIAISKGPLEAIQSLKKIKKDYQKNLKAIVTEIRNHNQHALIIFNELYNPLDSKESYYESSIKLLKIWNSVIYRNVKEAGACVVIPSSELFESLELQQWAFDEVHPNDFGHEVICKKMIELIL
jgi:lysophospholipase L1-like esterase